ncbi:MAG: hypothetical protein RL585_1552 [Pseudomonadota bacterium]
MLLNAIWVGFFLVGFAVALVKMLQGDLGIFNKLMSGLFDASKTGFDISLGLVGVMSLWLGIMRIGEKAGLIEQFAKLLAPFFSRIFPEVPKGHPAAGSMVMNMSANMLGLDNAATPLGLKAMKELQSLNPKADQASNAMIMFLVLNTAGITLIPTSVIAIRQTMAIEQGLKGFNGADIFLPALMGTFVSFSAGLIAVAWVQRIRLTSLPILSFFGLFGAFIAALYFSLQGLEAQQLNQRMGVIGSVIIMSVICLFMLSAVMRRVNVYESFIEGAKEGFSVAVQIIPYLIAMLVAISVFRNSGCMDYDRFVAALPVGLMKILSGSGARGLMVDVMKTYGVDSFEGQLAAIIQGSTETTFYVLAVYFGSVNIRKTRHAVACALWADLVGLIAAILIAYAFFGRSL